MGLIFYYCWIRLTSHKNHDLSTFLPYKVGLFNDEFCIDQEWPRKNPFKLVKETRGWWMKQKKKRGKKKLKTNRWLK